MIRLKNSSLLAQCWSDDFLRNTVQRQRTHHHCRQAQCRAPHPSRSEYGEVRSGTQSERNEIFYSCNV